MISYKKAAGKKSRAIISKAGTDTDNVYVDLETDIGDKKIMEFLVFNEVIQVCYL